MAIEFDDLPKTHDFPVRKLLNKQQKKTTRTQYRDIICATPISPIINDVYYYWYIYWYIIIYIYILLLVYIYNL